MENANGIRPGDGYVGHCLSPTSARCSTNTTRLPRAPVQLLNECDQFLGRRSAQAARYIADVDAATAAPWHVTLRYRMHGEVRWRGRAASGSTATASAPTSM